MKRSVLEKAANSRSNEEPRQKTIRMFTEAAGREDISRRDEFVKHYNLGGNRRQAIVYSHPVHYRAENGEWKEIDNTLEEVVNAHGRNVLRNKSNRIHMEFPQEADGGSMVSITADGKTFSWQFERSVQKAKAQRRTGMEMRQERLVKKARGMAKYAGRTLESLQAANLAAEMESAQEQRMEVPMLHAENRYDEVLPGVSVRYELVGNTLKEDIILSSIEALSRVSIRLPDTFNYAVSAQQELQVYDKQNGELLFVMNTPLVYDADGIAVDAGIQLTACAGYTRMEYVVSPTFLQIAAWPVTIDPAVRYAKSKENIKEAGLYRTEAPDTPHTGKTDYDCGNRGDYEYIMLLRFDELVKQKASDTIVSAMVGMHPTDSLNTTEYMACYPVKQTWYPKTATWNNIYPDTDSYISNDVISYVDTTGSTCFFNITNLYRSWYKAGQNFGIAFRYPLGVDGENHYVKWAGLARNSENGPCMIVNYLSHAGLESWWTYESMGAGAVGTAHVDLFNGNLVFEHADVAMTGNRMPVSVTHYYNSCLALKNEQGCGLGWRTSANQSLHKIALTTVNWTTKDYYVWTDGDGTEHYFLASGSIPYKDEETNTLELTVTTDTVTIRSKDDTSMVFPVPVDYEVKTYITSITDACGNVITYVYNADGKLEKIFDGANRDTSFSYRDGLLHQIVNKDGRTVSFGYLGEQLVSIAHSDLGTAYFTYENGLLKTVHDGVEKALGGVGIEIAYQSLDSYYDNSLNNIESCRATSLMQTGMENRGSMVCFDYLTSMTKVKVLKNGNTENSEGKTLSYQFNDNGNLACVFDELGYAKRADFDAYNAQERSSCMQKAVINQIQGIAFENTLAYWNSVKGDAADSIEQDTSERCLSMPSLKIVKEGNGEAYVKQEISVNNGSKYTFSAYVKAGTLSGGGAFLKISSGENIAVSAVVQESTAGFSCGPAAEGWERIHATLTAGSSLMEVRLVCNATAGTVYFACPQLETGEVTNRVNLLSNSDFARTINNTENTVATRLFPADWACAEGITTDLNNCVMLRKTEESMNDETRADIPGFLSGNALRMISFPASTDVRFEQVVPVQGSEGDVFVIGGWLNSNSVSSGSEQSAPCISYQFKNGSTSGDWQYANFSREWVGWQFGAWAIAATEDYTSLTISVDYSRNAQTAMFTNMFLYREQFGQSFTYDEDKNLTSVSTLAGQKSDMQYDDYDNLTSYVQPGAETTDKYTFTYGSTVDEKKKHLVHSSTTPMGVKQEFEYDAHGNVTLSKAVSDTPVEVMGSQTVYDANGNYPVKSYDARGNAVRRTISSTDFTLTSVTDPAGQSVNYEYDAAKRVTGVQAQADGKTYKNAYTYANNRIKTVAHNTTSDDCDVVYNFEYDGLGRKTSVTVSNGSENSVPQMLSTNKYSADRRGVLEEVEYGNFCDKEKTQHCKVKYAYDEFDRLEGVSYDNDDNDTRRYEYIYDATGEVAKVVDNQLHRSVETERDLAFRPRQSTLKDEQGNVLYRTTLYYDEMNRLEKFAENVEDETHTSDYIYDKDNRVTEIKYDYVEPANEGEEIPPYDKVTYLYDGLGRIKQRTATVGQNNYDTKYDFVSGDVLRYGEGATTPLVKKISHGPEDNEISFEYAYDNRGNITDVIQTGGKTIQTTHYEYDALGQLVRVNDQTVLQDGKTLSEGEVLPEATTWVYSYDRGGNITHKMKYAYTTGIPDTVPEVIPYEYGDPNWKDKLTSYNGADITYDEIGNPKDDGERVYTWAAGRQLQQIVVKEPNEITVTSGTGNSGATVVNLVKTALHRLKVQVLHNGEDITAEADPSQFVWYKRENASAAWVQESAGVKELKLSQEDMDDGYQYRCSYTDIAEDFGRLQAADDTEISHVQGTADANDTFALNSGALSVTTNRAADASYYLEDGKVKIEATAGEAISAQASFAARVTARTVSFMYNHSGLRTQKTVVENGITTTYDYTLHGKLITHLTKRVVNGQGTETGREELHFFYDSQSRPAFVEYGGVMYRYVQNLQGDIVAIVDEAGNAVVEYKYDAWGKPLMASGAQTATLDKVNPFRYRGYVWDDETDLYYLRSRYYFWMIHRFINADCVLGSSHALVQNNVYVYCSNNSINYYDPSGKTFALAIAFGFGMYFYSQVKKNSTKIRVSGNSVNYKGKDYLLLQSVARKGLEQQYGLNSYKVLAYGESSTNVTFDGYEYFYRLGYALDSHPFLSELKNKYGYIEARAFLIQYPDHEPMFMIDMNLAQNTTIKYYGDDAYWANSMIETGWTSLEVITEDNVAYFHKDNICADLDASLGVTEVISQIRMKPM